LYPECRRKKRACSSALARERGAQTEAAMKNNGDSSACGALFAIETMIAQSVGGGNSAALRLARIVHGTGSAAQDGSRALRARSEA
jgi:hypothetical protein